MHHQSFISRAMAPLAAAFALALVAAAWARPAAQGHINPRELRCEYLVQPLAVGEPRPRLTWVLAADRRAETQTAYRVLVASSPELLGANTGDLWDSGRVESGATAHIEYAGKPLPSRQVCWWKVMSWDRDGEPGPWSEPSRWEMGLLAPTDWSAMWIDARPSRAPVEIISATYHTADLPPEKAVTRDVTETLRKALAAATDGAPLKVTNEALGGDPAYGHAKRLTVKFRQAGREQTAQFSENSAFDLRTGPYPYLRRAFKLTRPVAKARLYATALGVYEMSINGQRIGDERLAPGWTDYRKRVQYRAFDVTAALKDGDNAIGAIIGPGWFSGRAGLFHISRFYGDAPALLAQLEITYADGTSERIVTDGSWVRRDGPIVTSDIMDGEIYDARLEAPTFASPVLSPADATGWQPVTTRPEHRNLVAQVDLGVRPIATLMARSITRQVVKTEPAPGGAANPEQTRWLFDLGQNMVGVVRLAVREPAGTQVTIRHGEMLNPDGTLYTTNLRGAAAIDTYIARGGSPGQTETFEPRFTYHGFRYVEVTGLSSQPSIESLQGIAFSSVDADSGAFECSDASLNQLQSNIVWGMRGNYVSIPTDCPQRDERMGWMADTQVFTPTAAYNADIAPFMTKWLWDVEESQREDGAHSDVAPVTKGLSYGTPAWADAGVIVPWVVYQQYGDRRILERHIGSMMRWVDWCREHSTGLIRDKDRGNDYGDWLSIGADTPKDLLGTAYFAHSTDIVARALAVLGRTDAAAKYRKLLGDIRDAFIAKYVLPDGTVKGHTQTCDLLALRFGLLPETAKAPTIARLLADIEGRGWRLSTGFVGVGVLLPTLTQIDRTDVAWRLLMQDQFPSWLFSVKHGATTIWERWDGWTPDKGMQDPGMNSFNHYSLGSCGAWFFDGICGIRRDDTASDASGAGFAKIIIAPSVPAPGTSPVTHATARYRSIRGDIASDWKLLPDGGLQLNVEIPVNTVATVRIPLRAGGAVTESDAKVELRSGAPSPGPEGVRFLRMDAAAAVLEVGSGKYAFVAK